MLWCGLLNGLCCINGFSWFASPEILYIFVVSNDSSKFISGSIEGNLLANIVFPTPGLPIKQQLCPPAAVSHLPICLTLEPAIYVKIVIGSPLPRFSSVKSLVLCPDSILKMVCKMQEVIYVKIIYNFWKLFFRGSAA